MKNVLVVDDNPIVRRHLRGLLERDGCVVVEAGDGEQALRALRTRAFDVMFLDLHMPGVDGTHVLQTLGERKSRLPVVLITSSESSTEIAAAFKLGARDYLLKPFREPQVRRAMQQATGLDYTTISRTRSDVALLDRDDGLAQVLRGLLANADQLDHVPVIQGVPAAVAQAHQVVFIGNLDTVEAATDPEEAETLGDIVAQADPGAVLVRLLPDSQTSLPELTVFHTGVARDDEAAIKRVLRAVRSGAVLSTGRMVRVLGYDGPPELAGVYWWTVRHSLESALLRVFALGSARATVDFSLAPDDDARLAELSDWTREFCEARMVEAALMREPVQHLVKATAAPTGFTIHPVATLGPTPPVAPAPVLAPPPPVAPPPAAPDFTAQTRVAAVDVRELLGGGVTRVAPLAPSVTLPVAQLRPVEASPAEEAPPNIVIPGFELLAKVGEGGMSRVYRAVQKSLRRQVCVKVLREEFANDPGLADRFQDEGIALAALRHPNIVSVLDVGRTDDGQLFMVMEYVDGGDLKAVLSRHERLPVRETVSLVGQLLSGLAEAHASGIIHRDLKPSNVLLATLKDGTSVVKLVDFGIAKLVEGMRRRGNQTRLGTVVGTPGYMAPEQLLGMEVSAPTDLYAVGVILFELITGRRPFVARDEFELAQLTMMTPVPHLQSVLGVAVPDELDELIIALLAKNPKDRPQSAAEVRARLSAVRVPVAA